MIKKDNWPGVVKAYRDYLPVSDRTPVITLLEGNTPLIPAKYFSKKIKANVYLKYEGVNPTGSFKDRGMTMAISKALEAGEKAVMCASTGNTSASAAAFAASAGIDAYVIVPEGKIALGKLAQALMHGAKVIAIDGNFDDALEIVKRATDEFEIALVNSLNPYRLQGQKTASFEIIDALGKAPDYLFIPVGNAGNITAYWMGFKEYYNSEKADSTPRMMGWQAAGAAPIVLGKRIKEPETFATAIRIGNPARWKEAEEAAQESSGEINMVTDEEIREAYQLIANKEGIFCEPASAASVAGLLKAYRTGKTLKEKTIVCVLTGHGLKDPDSAVGKTGDKIIKLPVRYGQISELLEHKERIKRRS